MESAVVKNLLQSDPAAATARVMALPEDRRPEFFRKWNYGHLEEQTDGAMAKLIRDTLPPDKVTGSLVHQAVQLRMQGGYETNGQVHRPRECQRRGESRHCRHDDENQRP